MFCVTDPDGAQYHFFETPDGLCTCGLYKQDGDEIVRAHPTKPEREGYADDEEESE